jgi:superfamily II DNA/RNA helicase
MDFGSLGLNDALLKAVTSLGYEEATPIQVATIPLILSGTDLQALLSVVYTFH